MPGILDIAVEKPEAGIPEPAAPEVKEGQNGSGDGQFTTVDQVQPRAVEVSLPGEVKRTDPNRSPRHKEFANLESERNKARAEAEQHKIAVEKHQKELEELRQQMAQRDQALASKQGEVQGLIQAQQEAESLRQQLEEARKERLSLDVTQDPDFQARFDTVIGTQEERLFSLAASVDVRKEDLQRAFQFGDEERIATIRDALNPTMQRTWDAAMGIRESKRLEREDAIKDSKRTYAEIQERRSQQEKAKRQESLNRNLTSSRRIVAELWDDPAMESFRADTALRKEIETTLEYACGNGPKEFVDQWTPEQFLRAVAVNKILGRAIPAQHAVIAGKDEEIKKLTDTTAEKDKKIKELEGFIQSRYGSLPTADGGDIRPAAPTNGLLKPGEKFFSGINVSLRR